MLRAYLVHRTLPLILVFFLPLSWDFGTAITRQCSWAFLGQRVLGLDSGEMKWSGRWKAGVGLWELLQTRNLVPFQPDLQTERQSSWLLKTFKRFKFSWQVQELGSSHRRCFFQAVIHLCTAHVGRLLCGRKCSEDQCHVVVG